MKILIVCKAILIAIMLMAQVPVAFAQRVPADPKPLDSGNSKYVSPNSALAYSLAGTTIPLAVGIVLATQDDICPAEIALMAGGISLGPSLGYFSIGENKRALRGFIIRGLLIGTSIYAGNELGLDYDLWTGTADTGLVILIAGSTATVIYAIVDFASIPSRARRYNERLAGARSASAAIYPKYFNDSHAVGLELAIRFK